jgi:hypothetical protein
MPVPSPRLVDECTACRALSVDNDDLAWLAATGQITPITVAGHRYYLWRQLEGLVRVYHSIQIGVPREH